MNNMDAVTQRLLAGARPRQPYPGLRPFEQEEWSIFFGREAMIDEVVEMLGHRRLVIVHGSSGSGKSSLIRAGVLPRLARQYLRHGVPWRIAVMRPSSGPLWNLASVLAEAEGRRDDLDRVELIRRTFDRGGAHLSTIVAETLNLAGQRLCLLVDQFEELFRYAKEISRDEVQLFVELLAGLLEDDNGGGVHAIVTMRSGYLGECSRYRGLAEAINRTQYLLPRMEEEALYRAICRPAELYGGAVDDLLARRLMVDAGGDQDELPLIQHALMLLWREARAANEVTPRLGLQHYLRHDDGAAGMLSDHADRVMDEAASDPSRQRVVELLFRALTDINAEGQGIRRQQRFDGLVEATGSDREILLGIVGAFRADGVSFLTPYPPALISDSTLVDISHEALIRCWRKIALPDQGWLQEEFRKGLAWRMLLIHADSFKADKTNILPSAMTSELRLWLDGWPPNWCERYGGGWQAVNELLMASQFPAAMVELLERFRTDARIWVERGKSFSYQWSHERLQEVVKALRLLDPGAALTTDEQEFLGPTDPAVMLAELEWPNTPHRRRALIGERLNIFSDNRCGLHVGSNGTPEIVWCEVEAGTTTIDIRSDPSYPTSSAIISRLTREVPSFRIARYPTTVAQYNAFLSAPDGWHDPNLWDNSPDLHHDKEGKDYVFGHFDNHPAVYVSWFDATAFCRWLSQRLKISVWLPNEWEWQRAAIGNWGSDAYPWGVKWDPRREPHRANTFESRLCRLTAVGMYPAGASYCGAMDMSGTVWEWCGNKLHEKEVTDAKHDGKFDLRVMRGGSWLNEKDLASPVVRYWLNPDFRYADVGFRVASSLSPLRR